MELTYLVAVTRPSAAEPRLPLEDPDENPGTADPDDEPVE